MRTAETHKGRWKHREPTKCGMGSLFRPHPGLRPQEKVLRAATTDSRKPGTRTAKLKAPETMQMRNGEAGLRNSQAECGVGGLFRPHPLPSPQERVVRAGTGFAKTQK